MTAVVEERPPENLRASLSHAVDLVRSRTGLDVLVEGPDGALLEYAVGVTAPPPVVRALLGKDLSSLRAPASKLRTVALVAGGPVISRQPEPGLTAVVIPVPHPDGSAWLWLVGREAQVDGPRAHELATVVAAHLPTKEAACDVEAVLAGRAPLPVGWEGSSRTVAVVRSTQPSAVVRALRTAARAHDVAALVGESRAAAVACGLGTDDSWLRTAAAELERLGVAACGAFCTSSADVEPIQLRDVARAAADVSDEPLARCDDLASRVAVRHAARALGAAPVGRNPVAALLEHDDRRGTDLARTLLVWLDAHGDAADASRRLCVHSNTLRYRLRRATEVLGNDLADADARLEVHLRLRQELGAAAVTGRAWPAARSR